eukprot:Gregarina_sp_Poly_1__2984@NODE_1838_length_3241_cov_40_416194_g1193_i0_p1_GENE_NODE_1838_length_3241_cov_40_416194_g1193_i0NODE_1838_length_3241_cov_40_416194_g1193_i0_p1_ORF_typecomplete_len316_score24_74TipAS/PF07739_13/0_21_NODE_1838_length_3241_cov_40_416194_g1193_i02321179
MPHSRRVPLSNGYASPVLNHSQPQSKMEMSTQGDSSVVDGEDASLPSSSCRQLIWFQAIYSSRACGQVPHLFYVYFLARRHSTSYTHHIHTISNSCEVFFFRSCRKFLLEFIMLGFKNWKFGILNEPRPINPVPEGVYTENSGQGYDSFILFGVRRQNSEVLVTSWDTDTELVVFCRKNRSRHLDLEKNVHLKLQRKLKNNFSLFLDNVPTESEEARQLVGEWRAWYALREQEKQISLAKLKAEDAITRPKPNPYKRKRNKKSNKVKPKNAPTLPPAHQDLPEKGSSLAKDYCQISPRSASRPSSVNRASSASRT